MQRIGKRTLAPHNPAKLLGWATVVGKKEKEGPLGNLFEFSEPDPYCGQESFEQGESTLVQRAVDALLQKTGYAAEDIDGIFAGDLLNQCVATSFGLKEKQIPYLGLYGACSTMAESLIMATVFAEAGATSLGIAVTGSHFCTAERQYRNPLAYGSQRTPTAQWTVTGSGAVLVADESNRQAAKVQTGRICIGRIVDLGITDANNMGAAMAPAAADTLTAFFRDTDAHPADFDAVVTGDLGREGSLLLLRLMDRERIDLRKVHQDCGLMIFDPEAQDTHAGGSGCGCSASVLCAHFLPMLASGAYKRILFMATGALMSPTTLQQKESIPAVAHLIELCACNSI